MRGEREQDEVVLLGPIRFENHSCSPNTKFFLGYTSSFLPHNKCVFLQVIDSIGLGEEITVSYGSNYFKDGSLKCRCPHKEKHMPPNRENLEPTTPRFQSPDVPLSWHFRQVPQVQSWDLVRVAPTKLQVSLALVHRLIVNFRQRENLEINGKGGSKEES